MWGHQASLAVVATLLVCACVVVMHHSSGNRVELQGENWFQANMGKAAQREMFAGMRARSARRPASLAAIRARESSALDALRRAANHGAAARAQSLKMLDVGGASGENKDPDDPWDTLHPPCRGLPTCSSSTSSPAVKEHQRSLQQKVRADKQHKGLSLPQQYARIMQNQGYFAPWSRVNSWADRVAINNIRKSNTPTALASKEAAIARENAKFARKFRGPHTSQYTGVHLSQDQILDPKYDPWSNAASREAYYTGY